MDVTPQTILDSGVVCLREHASGTHNISPFALDLFADIADCRSEVLFSRIRHAPTHAGTKGEVQP